MPKGIPKRADELTPIEGSAGGGGFRIGSDAALMAGSVLGGVGLQAAVMSDLKKSKEENAEKVRQINSRAQYEHEKAAGDPNALKLSFEEWKKL